jgi:hypothetical protein
VSALLIAGLSVGILGMYGSTEARQRNYEQRLELKDTQLTQHQLTLQKLKANLKTIKQQKTETEAQVKAKDDKLKATQHKIDELNRELQAKRESKSKATYASSTKTAYKASYVAYSGCGDNEYARYIYSKESGCSTTAVNPNGCYGIGQDCNGVVRSRCGANYSCQNEHFTSYAISRYGSWASAYYFWIRNHWW